jgi:hypothetical protein
VCLNRIEGESDRWGTVDGEFVGIDLRFKPTILTLMIYQARTRM